jgi:O-antigen ligase
MNWRKILVGPALLVVAFGLLQKFVWPFDVLKHFGYGPQTIDPYEMVDQKHAYIRIQSTLRGANPLGAYLAVVLTAMATLVTRVKARVRDHWWLLWVAVGLLALVVLFSTYSRSGWAAAVLSVAILTLLGMRNRKYLWRPAAILGAAAVLLGAGTLFVLRDNDRVQNIFFHTDEHSQSHESSNYGHFAAFKDSARDIIHQPFGGGTGTAGPASVHNELGPTRIAENYYLQIAQETGIIGLILFLMILGYMVVWLWRREYDSLARVLLASLIGISLIGLLSHVWTDDTLAYIWWGFAGVAIARLKPKSKHETTK